MPDSVRSFDSRSDTEDAIAWIRPIGVRDQDCNCPPRIVESAVPQFETVGQFGTRRRDQDGSGKAFHGDGPGDDLEAAGFITTEAEMPQYATALLEGRAGLSPFRHESINQR